MGREWSWGGRSTTTTTTKRWQKEGTPGCLSGVLQLFDFHQFQFPLHQPCFKTPESFLQEDPKSLKGAEPRNSLESEEEGPCMGTVSLSSTMKEADSNLPMEIRLGTKVDIARKGEMEEISSETSNSPATKTPNLVARLMGLDLLPDTSSPSFSSSTSSTSSSVHARRGKAHCQDHHLEERIASAAMKRDLRSRRVLQCRSNSNINFMENEVRYEMSGSRSLPDTPRISSARRSADADPRLSLQIQPDDFATRNSFSCSPYSIKSRKKEWKQGDENRSPSNYARQIVKQVKESVGRRKVGLDITNITNNEGDSPTIKLQKTRRLGLKKLGEESSSSKQSTPSCSPRLRFLEPKNKPVTVTSTSNNDQSSHSPRPKPLQPPFPSPPQPSQAASSVSSSTSKFVDNQSQTKARRKCKKGSSSSERFSQRLTKPRQISETVRNMREEPFIRAAPATKVNISDKKCKKTPLSSDLVNIAVPLKKEQQDSVAQGSKRGSQLSSCLSRKYNKQEETEALVHQDDNNRKNSKSSNSRNGGDAEFRYVNDILRGTGIYRDRFVSITRWFSPCHPLNPLIFHYLEHSFADSNVGDEEDDDGGGRGVDLAHLGVVRHRCNRKLLFELVDEILVDVVKPYLNMKPWLSWINRGLLPVKKDTQMTGVQLLGRLWSRIQSLPAANCQILEDIDALVEMDLPATNIRTLLPYCEEGESIVFEIERDILDSLLHETAAALVFVG